ncbi:hypothetical protein [Mesorhizobium temperatum]|uniref:Uncharacterized protein n=1 Tax=Mesorhizobium temperatum TaxID=241416 RepID=A0A271LVA0_9HYPH|nr:hypothetical protein [Mesorhizobium temperatum]PAQ11707.1 hypothetical protein CIT26_03310 [Mesorhizobium temperatum]
MNSELLPIWPSTWPEIWQRLKKSSAAPDDLFVMLVDGIAPLPKHPTAPATPPPVAFDQEGNLVDTAAIQARDVYELELERYATERDRYETALSSEALAKPFFKAMLRDIGDETDALEFLERAHKTLIELGIVGLADHYRGLVIAFLKKFNLRYELRGQFSLHATIPGLFSKLMNEVKAITALDAHLNTLMGEFEEAFSDLRAERTQARIKTCLQKQFNLLEGLGGKCPGVTETTLGSMCNQLDWPHASVKELGKKLYGFRSNYPGLGHAGSPQGVLRNLDMRDFVSLSLMLASFTPYVTHGLNSDRCYTG